MSKEFILFDLDGTLTEPRKKITVDVVSALIDLSAYNNYDVGIVTGSGLDFIYEQVPKNIVCLVADYLFPCNGTQLYSFEPFTNRFECSSSLTMKEFFNKEFYSQNRQRTLTYYEEIIDIIKHFQNKFVEKIKNNELDKYCPEIQIKGEIISERGSMINWCPLGRGSNDEDRKKFIHLDTFLFGLSYADGDVNKSWRMKTKLELERAFREYGIKNICVVLGGQTSFDIYPTGWDKTYTLNHLKNYKQIYFVGDKCKQGLNDYEIYTKLFPNAYAVSNINETLAIINQFITKAKNNDIHI